MSKTSAVLKFNTGSHDRASSARQKDTVRGKMTFGIAFNNISEVTKYRFTIKIILGSRHRSVQIQSTSLSRVIT